jgi:membrane protein DedA with SNARE-associated domain
MFRFVTRLMLSAGYAGITLLMFLENVFPPIPSELIMPLAGFMTRNGNLVLAWVIVAGTLGSVIGALPLYYAGRSIGNRRLTRWIADHGTWLAMSPRDLQHAEDWFSRHGGSAVFIGRLIPAIRSLISIPAGIHRMHMGKFLLLTTLGSAMWTAVLAVTGWMLGSQYGKVEKFLSPATNVIVAAMVIWYIVRVVRLRRAVRVNADDSSGTFQ